MKYKFPEIKYLNDVLPHIKDRSEFILAERAYGFIVNYMVAFPDTFHMDGIDDLGGAIRRECRGLIFDLGGNLISRPFQKFFNIHEREETHINNLDMTQPHVILEKMDGSMVRPLVIGGVCMLGTKMGLTEVGDQASELLTDVQRKWLAAQYHMGKTPLLEFISPDNKIVVRYSHSDLVLLGVRDNLLGTYTMPMDSPFTVVETYSNVEGNWDEYITRVRGETDREGDIIRFNDGHMTKLKNEWYVRIHRIKDRTRTDRNILNVIIHEEIDDVVPSLDSQDAKTIRDYESKFEIQLQSTLDRIEGLVLIARTVYAGDKKRVAQEFVPNLIHKQDARFIFYAMDGKSVRPLMIDHVKKSVGNIARYDALVDWLEMKEDNNE
jgi:RNA ligase